MQFGLQTDDVIGLTEQQRVSTQFQLTFSVVDESTWLYKNYKYPRYRNFYGYAQIMSGPYVVRSVELVHINQEVLYWFQDSTDILQSVGCGIKKVLKGLNPPLDAIVKLYLLRQRYTSVRFRLCPGVKANIGITWLYPERLCDEEVNFPPPEQGNPQPSNNKDPSPSPRPSDQGDDPKDRSKNDGKDDPNDDKPHEPVPGSKQGATGQWFENYSSFAPGCTPYDGVERRPLLGCTDGNITPVFVDSGQGTCGATSRNGAIMYGGRLVKEPRDIISITFDFVAV